MTDDNNTHQLAPAKRPRIEVDKSKTLDNPVHERKSSSLVGNVVLTSDAHESTNKLLASQHKQQPSNIWYGKVGPRDVEDTQSEIDSDYSLPTGKGTIAAILDSGINKDHMVFQGMPNKISPHSKSFVGGDITDTIGHGTHCAGLFCGQPTQVLLHDTNSMTTFQGTAIDAKVLVCKVVEDGSNIANIDAVCKAIDHILQYNKNSESSHETERVNVISLSFGTTGFSHDLVQKIQEALCNDIVIICAASNNGMTKKEAITYPARLGHVLCVGACNQSGKPTKFTPVGREVDFLAPGKGLWAPTIGGDSCFCAVSGTSFATPSLAGVVCQVLEDLGGLADRTGENRLVPLMSNVWCIRELLKSMATMQGRHSDESGYGSLEPLEYFEKTDDEKLRLIKKILHQ